MSLVGYNGADLIVLIGATKIAAVRTKSINQERTNVDVTTDDNDGWNRHLPKPGKRGFNVEVSGIVTAGNEATFNAVGTDTFLAVEIEYPNGDSVAAEDGFFLGNISQSTSFDGSVEFTASLMSSGLVTLTPAP
jgi:predicted secreted protein